MTPKWGLKLPGLPYTGPGPDGFLTRAEIGDLFTRYARHFALPVLLNAPVRSVTPLRAGEYCVTTPERVYLSESVVIATGYAQQPAIPEISRHLPPTPVQLHSSQYRTPESLPAGGVLVVGSAQSGAQIAEELYQRGRRTFLAACRAATGERTSWSGWC